MKIGQLARLADASPKAIRRYEALGLLSPTRHANGYREYDEHDARVAQEIRTLNRLGIPVEETRPFLDCLAGGGKHADDCPASLAGYQRTIDELTARIAALTEHRDALVHRLRDAAYRGSRARTMPTDLSTLPPGLPEPIDDGAATHLPGRTVPPLTVDSTDGTKVDLAELGAGRSVIYLYPLTGHPDQDLPSGWETIPGARGCTAQACDFRNHYSELHAAGAHHVFGLSSQDCEYQREVVDRLRLPFNMLSDPDLRLAAALSIPTFDAGGMTLYKRLTLITDNQTIRHVFYPVFPPNQHAQQVLQWLHDNPAE